jgi:hypothetical protein
MPDHDTAPTVRLDLTGRDLRKTLDPVLAHAAAPGAPVPVLEYVEITVTGGALYLAATDHYTLGVIRHPVPDYTGSDIGPLAVAADSLRRILRTFKPRESVRMDITSDALTLRGVETPIEYRIPADRDTRCVDWRKLIIDALTRAPQQRDLPADHGYLARFRSAARDGLPLVFRHYGRIVVVACGEHFIGALGTVRISGDVADPFTAWRTDLTPTLAKAA